jgi:uncharacterized protein
LKDQLIDTSTLLLPWKGFAFEDKFVLLHLPTSTIVEVPSEVYLATKSNDPIKQNIAHFLTNANNQLGSAPSIGKEPINIVSIALNVEESCNLRCTYCYAGDGNYGEDSTMHESLAIRAIEQLSQGKPKFHISFFGGEPLLNFPLIRKVIEWCNVQKETKYTFGMTTNGTLLNSTHLNFLKEHNVSVKISYDGDKAQKKQRLMIDKKNNAAELVKRKMLTFKNELEQIQMSIRATFSKAAVDDVYDSISNILNDFTSNVSYSKVASSDQSQSIDLNDVEQMGNALTKLVHELLETKSYSQILRITNLAASLRIIHKGYINRMTCGAGIGYISVSTKGEYFLCHRFTESQDEKVGDVKSGLDLPKLEQFQNYRKGDHAPCNTCWMQRYCRGGCFQENKLAHGSWFAPSEIFCRMQEIELTLAMEIFLSLKQHRPQILETL